MAAVAMSGPAAILLLILVGRARAAGDPTAKKIAGWAARGYSVKERLDRRVGAFPVSVVIYSPNSGEGDRLEAYVVAGGKAYLGYSHPGRNDRLELDTTPAGRFSSLLGRGSALIAYHALLPALNSDTLEIVRYRDFRFRLAASFPEGRFVQDDGRVLVLARDLPLGRFLSVGCSDFGTVSRTAFRTRLYEIQDGRFREADARHPRIYDEEIARKQAALARLRSDLQKNAGEYLGLSLSLYYDYAALGRARQGWQKQGEFFRLPRAAPAAVRACFSTMRADLRSRLGIPADWP